MRSAIRNDLKRRDA